MTRHMVSELEGALLDAAVAMVDGEQTVKRGGRSWLETPNVDDEAESQFDDYERKTRTGYMLYSPSEQWDQGGPIIERELNGANWLGEEWVAEVKTEVGISKMPFFHTMNGPTFLIAAMRAYVSSRFGEEVELP